MKSKEALAQTAFTLFLNNGYKAATLAELVRQSGLSKGAFYHYFASKKEVYDYVLEHYFLSYYSALDWPNLNGLEYKELAELLNKKYQEFVLEIEKITHGKISNYFIMFFEAYNNNPNFREKVRGFYEKLEQLLFLKLQKSHSDEAIAKAKAVDLIAHFEGMFFYHAVFPEKISQKDLRAL